MAKYKSRIWSMCHRKLKNWIKPNLICDHYLKLLNWHPSHLLQERSLLPANLLGYTSDLSREIEIERERERRQRQIKGILLSLPPSHSGYLTPDRRVNIFYPFPNYNYILIEGYNQSTIWYNRLITITNQPRWRKTPPSPFSARLPIYIYISLNLASMHC